MAAAKGTKAAKDWNRGMLEARERKILEETEKIRPSHPDKSDAEIRKIILRNWALKGQKVQFERTPEGQRKRAEEQRKKPVAKRKRKSKTPVEQAADAASKAAKAAAAAAQAAAAAGAGSGKNDSGDGMDSRLDAAREALSDDPIFGPGVSGKATKIAIHRTSSPHREHQVKGVSPGWLEDIAFELRPHIKAIIKERYGGGVFRVQALTDAGSLVSEGEVVLSGAPKKKLPSDGDEEEDEDDDDDGEAVSNSFFAYPGHPGWGWRGGNGDDSALERLERMRKEEREAADRRLEELRIQLKADKEAREAREERDRKEREAREDRLAKEREDRELREKERREAREERELRREQAQRERESKERSDAESRQLSLFQAMQTSTTQLMTAMMSMGQQQSKQMQTMMTAMMSSQQNAGSAAMEAVGKVLDSKDAATAAMMDVVRTSIEAASAQTTTDKIIDAAAQTLPEVGKAVRDLIPTREERAAKAQAQSVEKSVHEHAREAVNRQRQQAASGGTAAGAAAKKDERVWRTADGRWIVPWRIAQAFSDEFGKNGVEATQELIDSCIAQWCEKIGVQPQPAALPAPQPPAEAPPVQQPPAQSEQPVQEDAEAPPAAEQPEDDPEWMSKDCLKETVNLFKAGIPPLESIQHLIAKRKLTEAARLEIGAVYRGVDRDEKLSKVIQGKVIPLLAEKGLELPLTFVSTFQAADDGAAWLEEFLWVCSQETMEEAADLMRIMREQAEIEDARQGEAVAPA